MSQVSPVGDALNVHEEVVGLHGTQVAVHLAVGTFVQALVQRHLTLDDHLGVGRHANVAGLALHHLESPAPQAAGELELVLLVTRHLRAAGADGERVGTHGDGHLVAPFAHGGQDPPAVLGGLRVDADALAVANLAAVGAGVLAELRVIHDHGGDVDVAARIRRIVLQPGKLLDVHRVALEDDLLAGRAAGMRKFHWGNPLPAAAHVQPLLHVLHHRVVHLLVVAGDLRHPEEHRLVGPATVGVGQQRPFHPLTVDPDAVHHEGGRILDAELVDQPVGEGRDLVLILVHGLHMQHPAPGLKSADVVADGVEDGGVGRRDDGTGDSSVHGASFWAG